MNVDTGQFKVKEIIHIIHLQWNDTSAVRSILASKRWKANALVFYVFYHKKNHSSAAVPTTFFPIFSLTVWVTLLVLTEALQG